MSSLDYLCIIGHPGALATTGGQFINWSEVQITFDGFVDRLRQK
tara:strand:+ start:346 stop:477 length:132 start_codon:yes stop_codon:yes gene_type:complete